MDTVKRYAAKLLFQFRVVIDGVSNKRRTCEERIILFEALSAKLALEAAKKRGKSEEHNFENNDGNVVYFEFIGVRDLMELGIESDKDEVWYEIKEHLLPMERKTKLLPPEKQLSAIKNE